MEHGLLIKPNDGVMPFNRETVTDATHEKVIRFVSMGQTFDCKMQVPLYMWNALKTEHWDRVEKLVRARADEIRLSAAAGGELLVHQWGKHLEQFAKTCAYNEFMKVQVERGNGEGHAVPTDFL